MWWDLQDYLGATVQFVAGHEHLGRFSKFLYQFTPGTGSQHYHEAPRFGGTQLGLDFQTTGSTEKFTKWEGGGTQF